LSMMGGGWLYLLSAGWLVAVVVGQELGVTMCCPAGRVLKIVKNNGRRLGGWRKERGDEYIPKCVRNRRAPKDTLEGSTITVDDGGDEDLVVVKKTGVQLPACTLGRKFQMVSLKGKDDTGNEGSGDVGVGEVERISRVRLGDWDCGKSKCHQGNVYVDDKPVCDDAWDDTDANVVCKELGFTSGGKATVESHFGKVDLETQSGFDEVDCWGGESSLVDCLHDSDHDCYDGEGAGVVCYDYGSPFSAVPLTSTGDLVLADNTTYQAGEFCLAGVFQGEDEWDKEVQEGEAVAVMCEPCKSEVLCSVLLLDLFDSNPKFTFEADERNFDSNPKFTFEADERSFGTKNTALVGNFKEFKDGVDEYIKKVFNVLDKDADGSLDKDDSLKSLSAKFFLQLLNETFSFFDVNEDSIMSVEDAPPRSFDDRNDDGKISLREVFGLSLIHLPAPLYRLYVTLDKDKNEKISIEEATNFLKSALAIIDKNEDCSIDMDEIISTLDDSKLPKQYQLAVKLLGGYFLELADFIIQEFVAAADADGDKNTTLAEIISLKDPAVLFDILNIIVLGENSAPLHFIMGHRSGPMGGQPQHQAVVEMWLHVLYDFVHNKMFQSAPTDYCGLN